MLVHRSADSSVALTWVGHRIGHDGAGLCRGRQGDFAPGILGGVSQFAMFSSALPVAVKMEEVGDRAMDRDEALALSCRPSPASATQRFRCRAALASGNFSHRPRSN
jgi:hypothetical protein